MALQEFWDKFQASFIEQIGSLNVSDLIDAWKSCGNRTAMYENNVLEEVAQSMGMSFKKEEFKIDYTFCKKISPDYEVPLIYIESENIAKHSMHEMRKLCCLSAPLKILITCVEWSDEDGYWKNGGNKKLLTDEWASIISKHNTVWPQPAITGVLIAERKNDILRYYSLVFSPNGEILNDSNIIIERRLS